MADRPRFRIVSPFDDDDPAVRRLREALDQAHAWEPSPPPPEPDAALAPRAMDRAEIARLRSQVAKGDRSAADVLRDALRRARRGK